MASARLFHDAGLPVVAIVRDIRDALVRPLPPWSTEESINECYRKIWENLGLCDDWVRYEDLVTNTAATLARVASALGLDLDTRARWEVGDVPHAMIKLDRHELLRAGSISSERVGIWRSAERHFSAQTHETATTMGYPL